MQDRRQLRSESPLNALSLFLSERLRRAGAEALVVSTSDGLLLSGAGEGDLELLAAAAAMEAVGQDGRTHLGADGQRLSHASVLVDNQRVVVATLGGSHSNVVGEGVARILRAA